MLPSVRHPEGPLAEWRGAWIVPWCSPEIGPHRRPPAHPQLHDRVVAGGHALGLARIRPGAGAHGWSRPRARRPHVGFALGAPFGRRVAFALAVALLLAARPRSALAHGVLPPEPTTQSVLAAWSMHLDVWLAVSLAALAYWILADAVDARHRANPVPRWRRWSWLAGLAVIALALASPIDAYDTALFSVHMVQHMLLAMLAAPLLMMAAPVTLLLRYASPESRRRWLLPVLHSRALHLISSPVVTWGVFAGVMWFSHFSPLFDAALEDESVHRLEHALFLGAALLFWWPVVGADPGPRRLGHPARILYLAVGMPLSSFLGLVIFSAPNVLYPHYETLERTWGMTPLEDQAWAGGIMWAAGDAVFVVALIVAVAVWLRYEEREGLREDARSARRGAPPSPEGPAAPGSARPGGP